MRTPRTLPCLFALVLLPFASLACDRQDTPTATQAATATPAEVPAAPTSRPVKKGDKTFLALGDSYTIGEGVEASQSWPVVLASMLRDFNVSIDDPDIIARTGWTTRQLLDQIRLIEFAHTYDLVTVMVGVNDQYRGNSPEAYRSDFCDILSIAAKLSKNGPASVVVLSIPDWTQTPFGINSARPSSSTEIDTFNTIAQAETLAAGMTWIDVTPLSRMMASKTVSDGLHPSPDQLTAWAHKALAKVRRALR